MILDLTNKPLDQQAELALDLADELEKTDPALSAAYLMLARISLAVHDLEKSK